MPRITEEERTRFHSYLDEAIDKMNSPKNIKKKHWSKQSIFDLNEHFQEEAVELDEEIGQLDRNKDIESECFDCINIPMMIIDKLRRNK